MFKVNCLYLYISDTWYIIPCIYSESPEVHLPTGKYKIGRVFVKTIKNISEALQCLRKIFLCMKDFRREDSQNRKPFPSCAYIFGEENISFSCLNKKHLQQRQHFCSIQRAEQKACKQQQYLPVQHSTAAGASCRSSKQQPAPTG